MRAPALFVGLSVFGVFFCSAPAEGAGQEETLRALAVRVQPSVVEVLGTVSSSGEMSYGTGFVFRQPGIVVTNAHVVRGVKDVMVRTVEGALLASVNVIDVNSSLDLAVLRVVGLDAPPLAASSEGMPSVGTEVVAVGHPRGYEFTVSNGIVSAVRSLEEGGIELIQTTAPISPGSSGGPLVDRAGLIVGVCSLTLTEGQNINFAIPALHIPPAVEAALKLERGLKEGGEDLPAEAIARLARQHRDGGDLVRAEELVRRGLGRTPSGLPLLAEAAELAWLRGDFQEVQTLVDRMSGIDPGFGPGRQIRASLLAQNGDCEQAVAEARISLEKDLEAGQRSEAHAVLGECLGRLGQPAAALEHVDQALLSPKIAALPDYHAMRAFLLQMAGRQEEAEREAVNALILSKWDPLVAAALRERGLPRLVEIVSSKGTGSSSSYDVRGVARNRGPVPLEQVMLTAEGRDRKGQLVATGTGAVTPARLVPGQTGAFKIRLEGFPEDVEEYVIRIIDYKEP